MDLSISKQFVEIIKGPDGLYEFFLSLYPNDRILPASLEASENGMWFDVMRTERIAKAGKFRLHKGLILETGYRTKCDPRMEYIGGVRRSVMGGLIGYLFVNKDGEADIVRKT